MIQNKQELFDAITSLGFPKNLLKIWDSEVPAQIHHVLQEPSRLFDAFLAYPEAFPSSDELVILWETNGDSIVGFLRDSGVFVRHYLERGPTQVDVLGSTYQQMISECIANLIAREVADDELRECADFLDFQYLEQLKDFVYNDSGWEENTAAFIEGIEAS